MILATTLATWIIQMIMNRVESNAVYSLILQVNIAEESPTLGDCKVVYFILLIIVLTEIFRLFVTELEHNTENVCFLLSHPAAATLT